MPTLYSHIYTEEKFTKKMRSIRRAYRKKLKSQSRAAEKTIFDFFFSKIRLFIIQKTLI
jgi:hypothetical protein